MALNEAIPAYTVNQLLNPILWDDLKMRPKIRLQLLKIAKNFANTLKVKNLNLKDITISGSNASYWYSDYSDIDLHLIVDMNGNQELADYFNSKKNEYNFKYDLRIKGINVEVYVQDSKQVHHSAGIFSILDNTWIQKPVRSSPSVSEKEVKNKARNYASYINLALKSSDIDTAEDTLENIYHLRKAGLENSGELCVENLAFKLLRSRGQIDKLKKHIIKLQNAELSIGENMKIKDIVNETGTQAVITNYQPGKSVAVAMPDGTQIQKDLTKDPGAIGKDEQGNPVFNLAQHDTNTMGEPATQVKPISNGSQININTDPNQEINALENTEEHQEEEDLINQYNRDIGGDKTEGYINDVIDKKWERTARSGAMAGKNSGTRSTLPESDELSKWLTIAGLR
jgi:hypothetical protein